MPKTNAHVTRIVLIGLKNTLGTQLMSVLSGHQHSARYVPSLSQSASLGLIEKLQPDVVFCAAEPEHCYTSLLEAIKQKRPDLPVVVVSRLPEIPKWLNALEAGAADYCCPPFESTQIGWILEKALRPQAVA
jgi:DNA-binding NtrC family response regulator